jgi:hypothetical protein
LSPNPKKAFVKPLVRLIGVTHGKSIFERAGVAIFGREGLDHIQMDEKYLLAVARYIELNPVKANLAQVPEEYPWSSASAHLSGSDDILVKTAPLLRMVGNWQDFLSEGIETMQAREIECHERNGRPLGSANFVAAMEAKLGRTLSRKRLGPKRLTPDN